MPLRWSLPAHIPSLRAKGEVAMGGWGRGGGVWSGLALGAVVVCGCSGVRGAAEATGGSGPVIPEVAAVERGPDVAHYVNDQLRFELSHPSGEWELTENRSRSVDGLMVPVTLQHVSGATIVLQIAPAQASSLEYAERLTLGMQRELGAETFGLEPLGLAPDAVGFRFQMEVGVKGRVAVRTGAERQVYMLLATWPNTADAQVSSQVDAIFESLQPL
ncbi:MAG TPA: hypothetical protein VK013_03985, partial [Myxococcaceae bacterium]|nr:hypothetical protein [Myxococcaceae bacterium]